MLLRRVVENALHGASTLRDLIDHEDSAIKAPVRYRR
jgi:hypothetical protein